MENSSIVQSKWHKKRKIMLIQNCMHATVIVVTFLSISVYNSNKIFNIIAIIIQERAINFIEFSSLFLKIFQVQSNEKKIDEK